MRRAILLIAFFGLCGHAVAFQGVAVQRTSETIQLNVPPVVAQGSPATISGVVPTTGRPTNVTIHITPPSAAPISLSASTNNKGEFTVTFTGTATAGKYQVSVVSANGASPSNATFTVIVLSDLIASVTHEVQKLQGTVRQLEGNTGQRLATLPPSSRKQTIMTNLAQFRAGLDQEDKLWAPGDQGLPYALNLWGRQLQARPDAWAKAAPLFGKLLQWADAAHVSHQKILDMASKVPRQSKRSAMRSAPDMNGRMVDAAARSTPSSSFSQASGGYREDRSQPRLESVAFLASAGQYESQLCGPLGIRPCVEETPPELAPCENGEDAKDVLELAGAALTLVGSALDVAVEIGTLWIGEAIDHPVIASGAQKGIMVAAEHGHHWQLNAGKFAVDLAAYLADTWGEGYCDRWEGPFSAITEARAADHNGQPWWVNNVFIEGKLTLQIAKEASVPCDYPPSERAVVVHNGSAEGVDCERGPRLDRAVIGKFEGMATMLDVKERAYYVLTEDDQGRPINWGLPGLGGISAHILCATSEANGYLPTDCAFGLEYVGRGFESATSEAFAADRAAQEAAAKIGPLALRELASKFSETFPARWSSSIRPGGSLVNYMLKPTYFRVYVTGQLHGAQLTLHLHPQGAWDLVNEHTQAHARYLVAVPWGGILHTTNLDVPLPYAHARRILARAMGDDGPDPDNEPVDMVVNETTVNPEYLTFTPIPTYPPDSPLLPYCEKIVLEPGQSPQDLIWLEPGQSPEGQYNCRLSSLGLPRQQPPPKLRTSDPHDVFQYGGHTYTHHGMGVKKGPTVAHYTLSFEICSPECEETK